MTAFLFLAGGAADESARRVRRFRQGIVGERQTEFVDPAVVGARHGGAHREDEEGSDCCFHAVTTKNDCCKSIIMTSTTVSDGNATGRETRCMKGSRAFGNDKMHARTAWDARGKRLLVCGLIFGV